MDNIFANYDEFVNYLFSLKDENYALFHFKLLKNNEIKLIGIRTPILKKIAKKIAKNDYMSFLKLNKHQYYEEVILHGLVICYLKLNFKDSIKLFDNYINYIDSWASCDIIVSNYKIFENNLEKGLIKVKEYLNSSNFWINRVGLVILLSYYINDEYIDYVLDIAFNYKSENYYVKMANAWLISICLIKYYDKTYKYLLDNNLDDFTHNKAIQKAIESFRTKDKDVLKKLKRVN